MRRIWKIFFIGTIVASITLPALPQILAGPEKEYTFTGRLVAARLALNNVAPRMVVARILAMQNGKVIGTEPTVAFVPSNPDRTTWVGKFRLTGKVPEGTPVHLMVRGLVTYPNRNELLLEGTKDITTGSKTTIDLGDVPLKVVAREG